MFNNSKNLANSIYIMSISPDLTSLWVRGISLTAKQMSLVPAPIFRTKRPPLHTKSCISESLQKVSPYAVSPAGNASALCTKHFLQTLLSWVWQAGQAALLARSHPTLCDSMDCSSPGSSLHGVFQARILEWDVIPTPGHLLNPWSEPIHPASPALAGRFFTAELPGKASVQEWSTRNWLPVRVRR